MIKINLLPPNFRVTRKRKSSPAAGGAPANPLQDLPWKMIGMGVGALFLLLTIYFDFNFAHLNKKMKSLNGEWHTAQPKMAALKVLEKEVGETLLPEREFLRTHVLNKAPITNVLQAMSEALPDGMWLENFSMNNSGKERSFKLQGLTLNSEKKTNIEQIEEYLQKLKVVIPSAQFTYSTSKQIVEQRYPATAFTAEYKWSAD